MRLKLPPPLPDSSCSRINPKGLHFPHSNPTSFVVVVMSSSTFFAPDTVSFVSSGVVPGNAFETPAGPTAFALSTNPPCLVAHDSDSVYSYDAGMLSAFGPCLPSLSNDNSDNCKSVHKRLKPRFQSYS